MQWQKLGQEKSQQDLLLEIYPQLSAEHQTALRNIFTVQQKLSDEIWNPDQEIVNYKLELGQNVLNQINNLLSAPVPEYLKPALSNLLNISIAQVRDNINYYSQFTPEIQEDEIIIEEPAQPEEKWELPKEDKDPKKRKLTSQFLSSDIKTEREKEIEAQELGLSKEEYNKVNEPIEQATKITASIDFPNPEELDIDDFESALFILKDRQNEVPESIKDQYGILTDAVGIIANTDEDSQDAAQRAEIAFREFENVFAEVVNTLAREDSELFDDLNEWLGVIYVSAYKIAAGFDISPHIDRGEDLTYQQSGGSQAAYDFRKNIKDYWKKYRQGGVFKRIYNPETRSFSVEYVGNDPEKREKVLYNTRKNFDNYLLRLRDTGKQAYYTKKRNLEKERANKKEQELLKENKPVKSKRGPVEYIINTMQKKNKNYLNKLKALSTWPKETRQKELEKIELKHNKDLKSLEDQIQELSVSDQNQVKNRLNELEADVQQQKKILLASMSGYKLLSLAGLFARVCR